MPVLSTQSLFLVNQTNQLNQSNRLKQMKIIYRYQMKESEKISDKKEYFSEHVNAHKFTYHAGFLWTRFILQDWKNLQLPTEN